MKYAIVGNPNCGKTTIFNKLTGSNQKVGNWPGVTVDKKSGSFNYHGSSIELIDLPGIYSLSTSDNNSIDAKIACQYILEEKPDAVINVIDASNLERSLYLTIQLIEMDVPVILALNMVDVAKSKGVKFDYSKLSQLLRFKVIPMVGRKGIGIKELKEYLGTSRCISKSGFNLIPKYKNIIGNIKNKLDTYKETFMYSNLWLAVKLLENDIFVKELIPEKIYREINLEFNLSSNTDSSIAISSKRYEVISEIVDYCTVSKIIKKHRLTEILDSLCMNKYLGIPIFLLIMYIMFEFTITIGSAIQPLFDDSSRAILINWVNHFGYAVGIPTWITAIFSQGVGVGINTVLTFLPQIACLFLFLSILEDSGYMARAAFVMDRFMKSIGLPGKAFVPLIVGFGCNVPSVMATRTLDTKRDRILTTLMSPFICCGARLAIFAIFAGAFFPSGGGTVVFLIYIIGIICAVFTGLIVKNTLLRGDNSPFIMEIPVYHLPNLRSILMQTWDRSKRFLYKAGKIIIPACILIGALNVIQPNGQVDITGSKNSLLSEIGKSVTPVLAPMGVKDSNWPATVGLLTGIMAKEVVVGTLNTLYTQEKPGEANPVSQDFSLSGELRGAWYATVDNFKNMSISSFVNPFAANEADASMNNGSMGTMVTSFGSVAAAFAYMLFVLLYVPCIATVAVAAKEIGKGWAWFSVIWGFALAYCVGVISYQISLIGINTFSSICWILGMLLFIGVLITIMRLYSGKNSPKSRLKSPAECFNH
ncbi:MAG TPA: Fe(2+) transporter permease subunit FeoB [Victivallales bacterium]|nr:Fe(2+) transporter permease subunit FeoB [Victivallales bacterium]